MRGLIGYVESLKIHSAVETLDRFRQLSVHFFDHFRVRGTTNRFRCDHQHLYNRGDDHLQRVS